jgi:uncharacterized membrane protein YdbT with pleckstrin-like domain
MLKKNHKLIIGAVLVSTFKNEKNVMQVEACILRKNLIIINANNIISFNFKNLTLNNRNFSNNLVVAIA